ncbi:protein-tyrosine-phosphatase [Capsaspora owczarzaki ATCC 30864]|uniref:protein-tyrosine-phosphatase n=1 Tax=Capsaspora owczarzaki (strain ATCC 30864) TaxID=595528 RepID=A0A0D2WUQ8_CAPO3|nr:protein-tyrosine-phosphatase [Capsaspora owczarzaki ATCC 30864]KJE95743.1 protein-tyrosine-phosphatase [Capsaspora owczarzaki ATCC 30864]|eukprot:XP_004345753.2 protein-tyrosine-phosphatase [Capsaspora owczarzaki ATCC 30864]
MPQFESARQAVESVIAFSIACSDAEFGQNRCGVDFKSTTEPFCFPPSTSPDRQPLCFSNVRKGRSCSLSCQSAREHQLPPQGVATCAGCATSTLPSSTPTWELPTAPPPVPIPAPDTHDQFHHHYHHQHQHHHRLYHHALSPMSAAPHGGVYASPQPSRLLASAIGRRWAARAQFHQSLSSDDIDWLLPESLHRSRLEHAKHVRCAASTLSSPATRSDNLPSPLRMPSLHKSLISAHAATMTVSNSECCNSHACSLVCNQSRTNQPPFLGLCPACGAPPGALFSDTGPTAKTLDVLHMHSPQQLHLGGLPPSIHGVTTEADSPSMFALVTDSVATSLSPCCATARDNPFVLRDKRDVHATCDASSYSRAQPEDLEADHAQHEQKAVVAKRKLSLLRPATPPRRITTPLELPPAALPMTEEKEDGDPGSMAALCDDGSGQPQIRHAQGDTLAKNTFALSSRCAAGKELSTSASALPILNSTFQRALSPCANPSSSSSLTAEPPVPARNDDNTNALSNLPGLRHEANVSGRSELEDSHSLLAPVSNCRPQHSKATTDSTIEQRPIEPTLLTERTASCTPQPLGPTRSTEALRRADLESSIGTLRPNSPASSTTTAAFVPRGAAPDCVSEDTLCHNTFAFGAPAESRPPSHPQVTTFREMTLLEARPFGQSSSDSPPFMQDWPAPPSNSLAGNLNANVATSTHLAVSPLPSVPRASPVKFELWRPRSPRPRAATVSHPPALIGSLRRARSATTTSTPSMTASTTTTTTTAAAAAAAGLPTLTSPSSISMPTSFVYAADARRVIDYRHPSRSGVSPLHSIPDMCDDQATLSTKPDAADSGDASDASRPSTHQSAETDDFHGSRRTSTLVRQDAYHLNPAPPSTSWKCPVAQQQLRSEPSPACHLFPGRSAAVTPVSGNCTRQLSPVPASGPASPNNPDDANPPLPSLANVTSHHRFATLTRAATESPPASSPLVTPTGSPAPIPGGRQASLPTEMSTSLQNDPTACSRLLASRRCKKPLRPLSIATISAFCTKSNGMDENDVVAQPRLRINVGTENTKRTSTRASGGGGAASPTTGNSSTSSTLHAISAPCIPAEDDCPPQFMTTQPSQILPLLYLGNQYNGTDLQVLNKFHFKFVLNVARECPFLPEQQATMSDVRCKKCDLADSFNENISKVFETAFAFIDEAIQAKQRVLVHCLAGISRSATITIAYMMRTYRMRLHDAYAFVKQRRPMISPNINFMGQLVEYERILFGDYEYSPGMAGSGSPGADRERAVDRSARLHAASSLLSGSGGGGPRTAMFLTSPPAAQFGASQPPVHPNPLRIQSPLSRMQPPTSAVGASSPTTTSQPLFSSLLSALKSGGVGSSGGGGNSGTAAAPALSPSHSMRSSSANLLRTFSRDFAVASGRGDGEQQQYWMPLLSSSSNTPVAPASSSNNVRSTPTPPSGTPVQA